MIHKRKILQFSIAGSKAGRTQYILNNWKNIDKERFQFDFLTFSPHLDFAEELESQGCKIYYMPCNPQQDLETFYVAFKDVLENGHYDSIHIATSVWKGFEIEEIARECNVPQIIIHAHSSGYDRVRDVAERIEGEKEHYKLREQLTEDMATDFLACSETAAKWVFGDSIPQNKIQIMRNAIDTLKFEFSLQRRKKMREQLGLNGKYVLGHVGRMELVKNHEFMINAFYKIARIIPEAVLVLVGDGRMREQIEVQIRKLDLQDRVRLLGKRDDVNLILQAMDVFLLPSLFEGFPIALVEAQASGLFCVVSDTVTQEDTITNLVCYKPLVIDEWVEEIKNVYLNRNKVRKSMHLEVSAAGYEIRNQIKELEALYEKI